MAQGCELSFCFQHLGLNVAEYNNLIYHDTCADNVHQNIFTKKLKTRCGGGMESGCWVAAAAAADCYNTASLLHSWLQLLFNLSCHHNLGMRRNVRNANVEVVWCGDSEADSGGDSIRTRGSGATLHTGPCIQPISGQAPMSWTWSPWTLGMATGRLWK